MQCKDKFLIQTTTVDPNTDVDDLLLDTVRELITLFYRIVSKKLKEKKLIKVALFLLAV